MARRSDAIHRIPSKSETAQPDNRRAKLWVRAAQAWMPDIGRFARSWGMARRSDAIHRILSKSEPAQPDNRRARSLRVRAADQEIGEADVGEGDAASHIAIGDPGS